MQFFLLAFILVLFSICCTQNKQATKPVNLKADTIINKLNEKRAAKSNDSILLQFKNYLNSLDKEQMNNVRAALLNYEWLFRNRDTAVCDSGYALFHEFYGSTYGHVQEQKPPVLNPKRKNEFLQQIKLYGFKIAQYEGVDYYTEDRDSISPRFYSYISPTMKSFLQQLTIETNKRAAESEGGLTISPEELVDRYVFWQRFGKTNKNFILKTTVFLYGTSYATKLVNGTENTPLQIEGKLNEVYKKAFDYMFAAYENEPFVQFYKRYYQALLKNDQTAIHEFREWFDSYENKNVLTYEE
jgi:hypothetical protein